MKRVFIVAQILILIHSILERRKPNDLVYKRISKALPVNFLKTNLAWVYQKYQKLYCKDDQTAFGMESLCHVFLFIKRHSYISQFEADPEKDDKDKPAEYHELITESGFLLFFMLLKYKEINSLDPVSNGLLAKLEEKSMQEKKI